jgi:hypothetical protein
MSRVTGAALPAGRVPLTGLAPNGQRFLANPLNIWMATDSKATVRGIELGEMGPAGEQAHLGDFALPQRGVFVVGRAMFTEPVTCCDTAAHSVMKRIVQRSTLLLADERRRPERLPGSARPELGAGVRPASENECVPQEAT